MSLSRALRLYNEGRFAAALTLLRGLPGRDARLFEAHALRSLGRAAEADRVLSALGDAGARKARAALLLERARRGEPWEGLLPAARALGAEGEPALLEAGRRAAEAAAGSLDLRCAARLLRSAPEAAPAVAAAFLKAEESLRRAGRWAEGTRALRGLCRLAPGRCELELRLAGALLQSGRPAQARARARALRPSGAEERLQALVLAGRFPEAFREAEALLRRREPPMGLLSWPWAGVWPDLLPARAFAADRRALERLAPRSPWAAYYAGLLRRRCGLRGGRALLERLDGWPQARYAWMRLELGRARLHESDYEGALAALARAAAGALGWQARALRAEALLCLGRRGAALAEIRRAEAAAPAALKADAAAWRGMLHLWLGEAERARAVLAPAAAAGARYAPGWLGAALARLGRLEEAERALDAALSLKPWDREARVWRGEVRRLRGDRARARQDLLAARKLGCEPWASASLGLLGSRAEAARAARSLPRWLAEALKPRAGKDPRRLLELALSANPGARGGCGYEAAVWRRRLGG